MGPERIMKMPVDIHTGITDEMAKELAVFLGFSGSSYLLNQCTEQIKNLYKMFLDVDCLQLEVNPLAETPQGKVYTADANWQSTSSGYGILSSSTPLPFPCTFLSQTI